MPHVKFRLVSAGRPVNITNQRQIKFFNLATDDLQAEVVAAGYFNDSRADLTPGSIIHALMAASSGSPVYRDLRVVAVPAAPGNVTVALVTHT